MKTRYKLSILQMSLFLLHVAISPQLIFAADSNISNKKSAPKSDSLSGDAPKAEAEPSLGGEQVNVDAIREKYYARGDENELGVVQNRAYSKAHKFEFGVLASLLTTDPLLSATGFGAHLGYHFSECWGGKLLLEQTPLSMRFKAQFFHGAGHPLFRHLTTNADGTRQNYQPAFSTEN